LSRRLFGTDGIRARAGTEPLVEPTVRRFGAALGGQLAARPAPGDGRPLVLVGGDTRRSTGELARWAAQGLLAAGARVLDLGVIPTGGVARLAPYTGAAAGLVVSASHNPADDNGLKLIDGDGFKWSHDEEDALEARLAETPEPAPAAEAAEDGRALVDTYVDWLAGASALEPASPLAGLSIALDCAHGAASFVAGPLFERLGARVQLLFATPDGSNINAGCGSTHPDALAAELAGGGFDLGFAFDGDADRALVVDSGGRLHDGDALMFLWASELAARGELEPRAIVATSMSNLGLERALAESGIAVVRCDVGDRAVVDTLRARGLRLGGEQSGHLIDLARSTTGDGLLTALVIAGIVARSGAPLAALLTGFRRYPQLLVNVRVTAKPDLESLPAVAAAAREVATGLGDDGRLVLRYSGTEPLARIMLEGPDEATIRAHADRIAAAIRAEIGAI
jgi:phosphoglucosamine mutase